MLINAICVCVCVCVCVYGAAAVGKHPVPRKSLVDFSRVRVAHGVTATLSFQMSQDTFALVDETGARVVSKGSRSLIFDLGDGTQPVEISVTI